MEQLEVEWVDIDSVNAAVYNPRKIDPQALAGLKTSLREFGWMEPAVVNQVTNTLIGGHMRRRAWKELGNSTFPVVRISLETEAEEKAANVVLNNQEIAGQWDKEKLVEVLEFIKNTDAHLLMIAGFQNHQLERFKRQVAKSKGDAPVFPLAAKMMEHYDYVVIFCDNETDFAYLRTVLGVQTQRSYKKNRKGIGRVLPFRDFARRWEENRGIGAVGSVGGKKDADGTDGGRSDDVPPGPEAGAAGA